MSVTVFAERMGLFHKGSGGKGLAPADVCLSPPPAPIGPVPIPYVNVAEASNLVNGSKTVRVDGHPTALEDVSEIVTSTGDDAGNQGGSPITGKNRGSAFFMLWSSTVQIEGKGVCRHGDPTGQNCASMPFAAISSAAVVRTSQRPGDSLEPHPNTIRTLLTEEGIQYRVFVIGAPGPKEIRGGHQYQFVRAAERLGVNENTIWLVEKSGYEIGEVDLGPIERGARTGQLVWITVGNRLTDVLNSQFRANSIAMFRVFSHGVPGMVALRFGWSSRGLRSYGLGFDEVHSTRRDLFTPNAEIRFDACNTGSSMGLRASLAQHFSNRFQRRSLAWTGRTTYHYVNKTPAGDVGPSEIVRIDWDDVEVDVWESLDGRTPVLTTFAPAPTTTSHSSFERADFELRRRRDTREFRVTAGANVVAICDDPRLVDADGSPVEFEYVEEYTDTGPAVEEQADYENRVRVMSGELRFVLHRKESAVNVARYERTVAITLGSHRVVWPGLIEGDYYIEIYRYGGNSNFSVQGEISVYVQPCHGCQQE